jgi:flavin reductase (DIM6/NTAB) family NADH-FMN oxidoreductase RutF
MQSRMNSLNRNPSGNLFIMSREKLANVKLTDERSFFLNLCEQDQQKAFLRNSFQFYTNGVRMPNRFQRSSTELIVEITMDACRMIKALT